MDNRGVTPVVEKTITMGIVVLFIGGTTATLFGAAVPTYRNAVAAETGERVLAMASQEIERAIPPNVTVVNGTRTVDLPETIRGAAYVIRVDGRSLVLDHPQRSVTGRSRLALPASVTRLGGTWQSGSTAVVRVRSVRGGLAVELREATG